MNATTGRICSIQRFSTHDGPGIRTTVFFKGCPLRCKWCHNPESVNPELQLLQSPALCLACGRCARACAHHARRMEGGGVVYDVSACVGCLQCVTGCPSGALEVAGAEVSAADVLARIEPDRVFYEESGGGLTLSGGEPASQSQFAMELLSGARVRNIHTCVQTCGFGLPATFASLAPLTSLFLWDMKDTDSARHKANTGVSLEPIVENLRLIDSLGADTILTCLLLDGINLNESHLSAVAAIFRTLHHCRGVTLHAYHPLGQSKAQRLGQIPADNLAWEPTPNAMSRAGDFLRGLGVPYA